jgi:hypothetical protein
MNSHVSAGIVAGFVPFPCFDHVASRDKVTAIMTRQTGIDRL